MAPRPDIKLLSVPHPLGRKVFQQDGCFRRNLFEIKDSLGQGIEAEMWDRGWTKIYEVYTDEKLTPAYQAKVGLRMAEIITCLHPIYVELRSAVAQSYR